MANCEVMESLRKSVLFESVSETVLERVADIVIETSIEAGETLITKGELGESMYILRNGKVKVHDGDLILNYLGQGNAFGEMAALDGEIRTASITAVEDSDLIQLNRDDLFGLFEEEPAIAEAMIHFLCKRGKNVISDVTERSLKLRTLEREFEIGRHIQAHFLPESFPEVPGWDIAAYFKATHEVAGDFYDVFELKNQGKTALVIGDVCGKGIGAALFMSLFRSLVRAALVSGDFTTWVDHTKTGMNYPDIRRVLHNSVALTNNYVATTHASACMFVTLFVGILDHKTGSMLYVNAGHESPVIYNEDGVKSLLETTGPIVGLFAGEDYKVAETKLEEGDCLLGFTDGVTEAVNGNDELFGSARTIDIAVRHPGSSQEKLDAIVRALAEFSHGLDQFDDITLLAVSRA